MKTRKVDELWSHLHWLSVLASMGTFTAAAQRLGVSKAAFSHRIQELENAAGVALVLRTTRSVRLTEAGTRLVEQTRGAFEEISRTFAGITDLADEPSGLLRVTVGVALGRQQIAPRVPRFLRRYPNVRVELQLSDHLASLEREGFDLGIRHATTVPDNHVAWELCGTLALLVASPAYLGMQSRPVRPEDLAQHNCIHYLRPGETPRWSFTRAECANEEVNVPIVGTFAANNSEVVREAALAGVGIALLPDFSAQRDLAAGNLVGLLPDWTPARSFGDRIFALRPYSKYVPRAVQVFIEFVRAELKNGFV